MNSVLIIQRQSLEDHPILYIVRRPGRKNCGGQHWTHSLPVPDVSHWFVSGRNGTHGASLHLDYRSPYIDNRHLCTLHYINITVAHTPFIGHVCGSGSSIPFPINAVQYLRSRCRSSEFYSYWATRRLCSVNRYFSSAAGVVKQIRIVIKLSTYLKARIGGCCTETSSLFVHLPTIHTQTLPTKN